jgi:hypothetical protein
MITQPAFKVNGRIAPMSGRWRARNPTSALCPKADPTTISRNVRKLSNNGSQQSCSMTSLASCRTTKFKLFTSEPSESRSEIIGTVASHSTPLSGCEVDTFDPQRIILGPHPGRPLLPTLKLLRRLRGNTFQCFVGLVQLPEISERRSDVSVRGSIARTHSLAESRSGFYGPERVSQAVRRDNGQGSGR